MAFSATHSIAINDKIHQWATEFGFQQIGISHCDLSTHEKRLNRWLAQNFHGEMEYMSRHGTKRNRPQELVPGTLSVLSLRMDYFPTESANAQTILNNLEKGYISRYALGRDYHKVLRKRLEQLAQKIRAEIGDFNYRVFTDSAPVLEKGIAEQAGLGWIGKHTNLINRKAGSWFFLGEIYTDLPLEIFSDFQKSADAEKIEENKKSHCGTCTACIQLCPTNAIVEPYVLDARHCISYLTIELHGAIPEEFRRAIGNRIYGCDDCQLVCPWNRFSQPTTETDFQVRHGLDAPGLLELFAWDETEFLHKMEGSPIRRIGYERWQRNLAVALGNALLHPQTKNAQREKITQALQKRLTAPDCAPLVAEHIRWALEKQ